MFNASYPEKTFDDLMRNPQVTLEEFLDEENFLNSLKIYGSKFGKQY